MTLKGFFDVFLPLSVNWGPKYLHIQFRCSQHIQGICNTMKESFMRDGTELDDKYGPTVTAMTTTQLWFFSRVCNYIALYRGV